jgi:hypothetical protein
MAKRMPMPLADYQRVYQVIYSVLTAAGGEPHRACIFFSVVGMTLLRERYKLNATISAGLAVYKLDADNVLFFGRKQNEQLVADGDAFHAWVEVDGYAIDFMAPLFADVAREEGLPKAPRRMFQKPLAAMKALDELEKPGDFMLQHSRETASTIIDYFGARAGNSDLLKVCESWFVKPPRPVRQLGMADSDGGQVMLTLRAPSIEGVW